MRGTQLHLRNFVNVTGRGLYQAGGSLARFGLIMGGVGAAAAGWALKAGANFELLKLRMQAAFGGGERAAKAWQETVALAVKSPAVELQPLVRARIMMANFGITGIGAMQALAAAAMMTQRDIEDLASTIGSLETEPLRRLGITSRSRSIKTANGGLETWFNMSALDTAGRKMQATVKGIDAARRAALQMLFAKYSGPVEAVSNIMIGSWRAVSDQATLAIATMAEAANQQAIPALRDLGAWFEKAHASGKFVAYGKRIAGWSNNIVNSIRAAVMAWNSLSKASREQLQNMLLVSAGFALAWHTGFVQVFIKSLGYLIVTNKRFFAAFIVGMTGLTAYILGNKIGDALEASFGFSSRLLKFGLFTSEFANLWRMWLPQLVAYTRQQAQIMWKMILIPGYAASGGAARAMEQAKASADLMMMEQLWNASVARKKLEEEFARIDAMDKGEMHGERPSFGQAMLDEFTSAKAWMDEFAALLPDSLKEAWAEFLREAEKMKKGLPGFTPSTLPEVGNPYKEVKEGAEEAAEGGEDLATAMEKVAKMTAPLRGFSTGTYGLFGGRGIARRLAKAALPAIDPAVSAGPLQASQKQAAAAAGGTADGTKAITSRIDRSNTFLQAILSTRASFSFA